MKTFHWALIRGRLVAGSVYNNIYFVGEALRSGWIIRGVSRTWLQAFDVLDLYSAFLQVSNLDTSGSSP